MCQPLSIPAAWRGKELFERKDWAVRLTSEEVAELRSVLDQPTGQPITEIQRDDIPLPICSRMLARLQQDLEEGSGACLVKGLPLDEFSEVEARRFFWSVAIHVGTPVSQSAVGERIFSVRNEGFPVGHPQRTGRIPASD